MTTQDYIRLAEVLKRLPRHSGEDAEVHPDDAIRCDPQAWVRVGPLIERMAASLGEENERFDVETFMAAADHPSMVKRRMTVEGQLPVLHGSNEEDDHE